MFMIFVPSMFFFFFLQKTFMAIVPCMFLKKIMFTTFVPSMLFKLKIHSGTNVVTVFFAKKHVRVLVRTCSQRKQQQKQKQSDFQHTIFTLISLRFFS